MFEGLKKPKNLTHYKLMNGVTDFGQLTQFNNYETGYSFLIVCQVPKFMEMLAAENSDYQLLLDNYVHILEYEFRGLDGLDNLTVDTLEINDGISTINVISKVIEQSASEVQMRFFEKSGSVLTRFNELYLKGIKDSRTQTKTYHGLIQSGKLDDGFENEVFTLLYGVTDNTRLNLEKAYLLIAAQPNSAELSMYESEKGTIENREITMAFNCFPVTGDVVNKKAKAALDWMNNSDNPNKVILNSNDFAYTGVERIPTKK